LLLLLLVEGGGRTSGALLTSLPPKYTLLRTVFVAEELPLTAAVFLYPSEDKELAAVLAVVAVVAADVCAVVCLAG